MQLQGLQDTLGTAPEKASERLARILSRADEALSDARQAIWDMRRSADRDESLGESLERAAREAVDGSEIDVQLVVSGTARPLTPVVEETLRRVGSEAVRNAARHAGARQVRLELAYRPRDVQLIVRDDGRGLDERSRRGRARRRTLRTVGDAGTCGGGRWLARSHGSCRRGDDGGAFASGGHGLTPSKKFVRRAAGNGAPTLNVMADSASLG